MSLKPKLNLTQKRELESFYSKKDLEQNVLGLANIFKIVNQFYLPVRLDYRGRLYCITEYLNYQGIELAKGLLQFSIGEKVYLSDDLAIKYLKIFGANCYGNKLDKKSFNDRIAWVDKNLEDIINFDNGVLLNNAENKILFLSFCFEYIKYIQALNNKDSFFVSNLPIQLDASCNGFQHLTLLVDDLALSKELNLNESTWNDNPKDFYHFIALKVKNFFANKLDDSQTGKLVLSLEDKESYKKLARLDIYRALIKKAVMTIPYNITLIGIIEQIKDFATIYEELDKKYFVLPREFSKNDKDLYLTLSEISSLGSLIFNILNKEMPILNTLRNYLDEMAKIILSLGL